MERYVIPLPPSPRILPAVLLLPFDIEVDAMLGVPRARSSFQVDGTDLTATILDTGLRVTHECFRNRVLAVRHLTTEGNGADDVTDTNVHGTNVAGIVAAGAQDARRVDAFESLVALDRAIKLK